MPTPRWINYKRDSTFVNIYTGPPEEKAYVYVLSHLQYLVQHDEERLLKRLLNATDKEQAPEWPPPSIGCQGRRFPRRNKGGNAGLPKSNGRFTAFHPFLVVCNRLL